MKKIEQTKFADEGNCLAACLAMMLDVPISKIPDFADSDEKGNNWRAELNDWLEPYGYHFMTFTFNEKADEWITNYFGYHMMIGKTTRHAEIRHCCIGHNGKLWFDPFPGGCGLTSKEKIEYGILVPTFNK